MPDTSFPVQKLDKHAPRPWFALQSGANYWITTANGLDETIACLAGTDPVGWPREANAKLLATAPEMLEVLETIENDGKQVPVRKAKGL